MFLLLGQIINIFYREVFILLDVKENILRFICIKIFSINIAQLKLLLSLYIPVLFSRFS